MRRFAYICIIIFALCLFCSSAFAVQETDLQVKRLHAEPSEASNVVFEFPIEVKLLGYTEDRNWYKFKVSFNLGLVNFTYVGWAKVPIGTPEAASQ
ncbi:MAG: hypothetical protein NT099_02105 [Candidatus Saganbacteria bacterium]|nr:hypothetical protein [Candidatus Saganbacteria bacterium]